MGDRINVVSNTKFSGDLTMSASGFQPSTNDSNHQVNVLDRGDVKGNAQFIFRPDSHPLPSAKTGWPWHRIPILNAIIQIARALAPRLFS